MAFKMKGHSLPGINQRMDKSSQPDGRAKSSAFQKDTDPVTQGGVTPTVTVSGGDKTERHADKFNRVKKESTKGNDKTRTAKFAAEYGGTWTKQGNVYRNQDGQSVKEAAIAQGQKKSKEKRDYVAENTTKKSGAPKKTDTKDEEKNEFGETPEQYKQRMIDMGLRKSDAKEEIDSKENKKASKRDKATGKPGAPAIWPFKKKVKTSGAVLEKERKKKSRGKKIKTSNNKLRNAFNKTTEKISNKIQEPGKKGNRPGFD